MKSTISLIFILCLGSWAHAQESSFNRYFEERARGDAAADDSRAEFARTVCETAIKSFCPGVIPDTNKPCSEEQKKCGSPVTIVEKRFISKYGVGLRSAERDVLPTLHRIFQVMKEIELHQQSARPGFSPSVQNRLPFIMKVTALSENEIKNKWTNFTEIYFPQKLKTIKIDYWGYFQQQVPARPEFKFNENEKNGSLTVNFRWCSSQKRFIDESSHLVGDVLASAIMKSDDRVKNFTASDYEKACESLPVEK